MSQMLKTISIKDFEQIGFSTDFQDNDIFVSSDLRVIGNYGMARFGFCLILFCESGHAQMKVNNRIFVLRKDDVLVCLPFFTLQAIPMSKDLKVTLLGCSANMLNAVLKGEGNTEGIAKSVYKRSVWNIPSSGQEGIVLFQLEKLIIEKVNSNAGYCHKKILLHLFCALLGELLSAISILTQNSGLETNDAKRASVVFRCFMSEIVKDEGMHRSVAYYANLLCYSPKYVSYVVKAVSGKTASHWINENAMEHIKYHLKYSDMSIKEIANHFNFPNISFFGKYVKRYVGMSPMQYRNLPEGKQNVCVASKI